MHPHNRSKPKTQQRVKPNLYIETEFESEDDAANTVVLRLPDAINEYDQSGQGLGAADPSRHIQRSFVENLQLPERSIRLPSETNPMQQYAIGLKTLNIFQKLWKRRMFIECFNAMRLTRASGLTRQQSQTDFRHKHSTSLVEPQRGRWALLNDRSVNRIGSTHDESSIERARLLNEIVDKLSHRSSSRRLVVEPSVIASPSIVVRESEAQVQHQRTVEHKLDRLETMLRDIKRVHEASTVQTTIYSMKRPEPERRRRRKAREQSAYELKEEGNRSYLLKSRQRNDKQRRASNERRERQRQRLSRQRREREFFERQRLRLEAERQHYARKEAEKQLQRQRESKTELNRELLRSSSSQQVLELSKEIQNLKEEVKHLKSIGEANNSSLHSQSPRNPPLGGHSIYKQLYGGPTDKSPRSREIQPLIHPSSYGQFSTNYVPYNTPLQQHSQAIHESRQNSHISNSSFAQQPTAVYVQPVSKSPVYMQHRSVTHLFEPTRTRMVEAHKLPAKPAVDYGPRLGSPPGMVGVLNRSRSPTTLHNCPLCGCSVCKEHNQQQQT